MVSARALNYSTPTLIVEKKRLYCAQCVHDLVINYRRRKNIKRTLCGDFTVDHCISKQYPVTYSQEYIELLCESDRDSAADWSDRFYGRSHVPRHWSIPNGDLLIKGTIEFFHSNDYTYIIFHQTKIYSSIFPIRISYIINEISNTFAINFKAFIF